MRVVGWSSRYLVTRLSKTQCEFLIDHVDDVRAVGHFYNEDKTRNVLITQDLIYYDQSASVVGRPKGTRLTDKGREIVCIILGEYADALVRWGYIRDRASIAEPDSIPTTAVHLEKQS